MQIKYFEDTAPTLDEFWSNFWNAQTLYLPRLEFVLAGAAPFLVRHESQSVDHENLA